MNAVFYIRFTQVDFNRGSNNYMSPLIKTALMNVLLLGNVPLTRGKTSVLLNMW